MQHCMPVLSAPSKTGMEAGTSMKIILFILISLAMLMLGYFAFLAARSHSGTAPGLKHNRLSPCPETPNCICTEYPQDATHYTAPIELSINNVENLSAIHNAIRAAIEKTGGDIQLQDDHYLSATYTSSLFRYVDDFELRIDTQNQQLHIRSASRVGRSDLGANQKRVNAFIQAFHDSLDMQQ